MLINKIFILSIILTLSLTGDFLKLFDKFGKVKKKITKLLNKRKGSELILDINNYEYPRANETLRKIHRELWQEYYDCLKNRFIQTGVDNSLGVFALTILEGASLTQVLHNSYLSKYKITQRIK